MSGEKKRWIAAFEIESLLTLPAGSAPLLYEGPGGVQVRIINGEAKEHEVPLLIHLMLDAEDIFAARKETLEQLHVFLRLLTFVTSTRFKVQRRLFVMDWSPTTKMREAHVWAAFPDEPQQDVLDGDLLDTLKTFHAWSDSPVCQRALRWFASAVRATNMEDQFQYFWFVIEFIAQSTAPKDRVPDVCQTCGDELYCRKCGKVSTHRPFAAQQIAMLLKDMGVEENVAKRLRKIRNMLMHGDTREDIEAELAKVMPARTGEDEEPGYLAENVDLIGRIARNAVVRSFKYPPGVRFQPVFLEVKSFVHRRMEAIADMALGLIGDTGEPVIENIGLPKVSVSYVEHEQAKPPVEKK